MGQYIKTIVEFMIKALHLVHTCIYTYGTFLDMEALVVAFLVTMTTVYKIAVIQALIEIRIINYKKKLHKFLTIKVCLFDILLHTCKELCIAIQPFCTCIVFDNLFFTATTN